MAILKVANVHFTQSGNNRLEYSGNGILKLHSEALRLPVGTTSSTPQDEIGLIRYNSDNKAFEGSNGTHWAVFESTILGDVRSVETGIGANNFATATIAGANTAVGQGANSFTTAANTFLRNTIAGANTAVGTGANAFSSATIAGANTAVGAGANLFASATITGANTAVGQGSNAFTTAANTFLSNLIIQSLPKPTQNTQFNSIGVGTAASNVSGEIRASVFRNSNDTNARLESNVLAIRGTTPTVYFRDTDGNSTILETDGNRFFVKRAAADQETPVQVNGQWPAIFNLANNDCTIGGNFISIGNIIVGSDVIFDDTSSTRIRYPTANSLSFVTRSVDRVRIDSSGNVGIGITSPTSALHVAGTANVTSALTAASIELGHPSDTTLARSSAGNVTIEGNIVYRAGGTDVPVADGGTGASDAANARTNLDVPSRTGSGASGTWGISITGNAVTVSYPVPSGTKMVFVQTNAPTGWTKDTTHNNKALRVVNGTASSGGSVGFTTAFASQAVSGTVGSTTLTTSQMPSHNHTQFNAVTAAVQAVASSSVGGVLNNSTTTTGSTGGGGSHDHSFTGTAINLAVQYVDVIIATKD